MEYELVHWGIKDMKWGVRRYQNKDGTLTAAGKKRYARDAREKGYDKTDEEGQHYKSEGKKGGRKETLKVDASRYVTEDWQRTKKVAEEGSSLTNRLKQINDKSSKNKRERLNLDGISDQELRNKINRELLERQYNDVFNPPTVNKGKEYASKVFEVTGDILGVAGSALGLALAVRQLTTSGG